MYLLAGSVLFAFLRPEHVAEQPVQSIIAACIAVATTMAASQLPRWGYVRQLASRGVLQPLPEGEHHLELHADFWTLGFAVVCVSLAFATEVRPGYAYGIIGALSLNGALRLKPEEDRGQLQAWHLDGVGMLTLAAVAFAAWVAYSVLHAEHEAVLPAVLQEVWALGSETAALGLIPLAFLPGHSLWRHSRLRWALLWAPALFLYIQSVTPVGVGSGPITIAITLAGYAALTAGFWSYFRYRHDEGTCASCRAMEGEPEPEFATV